MDPIILVIDDEANMRYMLTTPARQRRRPWTSSAKMVAYPVSNLVNNARHDGPECVAKVDETVPDQF